jgi:polyisoprenoid-binding protein YceI
VQEKNLIMKNVLRIATIGLVCTSAFLYVHSQTPGQAPAARPPAPPPTAGATFQVTSGTASYRVNEQMVGIDFPNEAIGMTDGVTGTLKINPDGTITPESKLSADLRNLKSDQDRRDNFIKTRVLETEKFPDAVFVPRKIDGLPKMIPSAGQVGVSISGDLTVHGVTKPVTFRGYAIFNAGDSTASGRATTSFSFSDFGLTKPKIPLLLSVDDKINLDLVYHFKRS